jgi:chromosome segregation ATPase
MQDLRHNTRSRHTPGGDNVSIDELLALNQYLLGQNSALQARVDELTDQLRFEVSKNLDAQELLNQYALRHMEMQEQVEELEAFNKTWVDRAHVAAEETTKLREELARVTETADDLLCELTLEKGSALDQYESAQELQEREHTYKRICAENLDEIKALKAELEALKNPKPKIVKQTWQNIYSDEMHVEKAAGLILIRKNTGAVHEPVASLRRDHYSDGTVKCELEKIGGEG